jgi:hypothetical protein
MQDGRPEVAAREEGIGNPHAAGGQAGQVPPKHVYDSSGGIHGGPLSPFASVHGALRPVQSPRSTRIPRLTPCPFLVLRTRLRRSCTPRTGSPIGTQATSPDWASWRSSQFPALVVRSADRAVSRIRWSVAVLTLDAPGRSDNTPTFDLRVTHECAAKSFGRLPTQRCGIRRSCTG